MEQRKKILVVYRNMKVGGSTTSLLAVLDCLVNEKKYDIDLILRENIGPLLNKIPKEVNVLEPAYTGDKKKLKYKKLCSIKSIGILIQAFIKKKVFNRNCEASQLIELDTVRYCRVLEEKYDIAISFLEQWSLYYLSQNVKSEKYITWIHTDYAKAGLARKIDVSFFEKMDTIVTVSSECCKSFRQVFPEFSEKTIFIENMVMPQLIRTLSKEGSFEVREDVINFVTVARLDLTSKAYDRTIRQFKRIIDEKGYINWHWYIIGGGNDKKKVDELIKENKLESYISLLGEKLNPYMYECKCAYFLLLSYFEGKPMSVEEAKILGVVPVITDYVSAKSQVRDGETGYICENSNEGVYGVLLKAIDEFSSITRLQEGLKKESCENFQEITELLQLLEKEQ